MPLSYVLLHFIPYGNHPYVTFATGRDATGQFWVIMQCSVCLDRTEHPCDHPEQPGRVGFWVGQYSFAHAHGLRPGRPQ